MRLDILYTDHMVLQRHSYVRITGCCDPDEEVSITFLDQTYKAEKNNDRFMIIIPTQNAGGPYRMVIKGDEIIVFDHIYIGDVFLLGGQSNMEFKVNQLAASKKCISNAEFDHIYFFQTPQVEYCEHGQDYPSFEKPQWKKAMPDTISSFSAVGYYIARQLDCLNIPIGLVECNKGGTSASCWIDEEALQSDPNLFQIYVNDYYKGIENQTDEQEDTIRKDYFERFNAYQNKVVAYQKKYSERSVSQMKQDIGHTPWPMPRGHKDFCRPSGLFQTMFKRICDYSYKAVVWYQGEEDAHNGHFYDSLLKLLIQTWRHSLGFIPFFIVQLPKYQDDKTPLWPYVREAQRKVSQELPDCHLVVSIDEGEQFNIHPVIKEKLGERTGKSILEHLYYKERGIDSPQLIQYIKADNQIVLCFDQFLEDHNHGKGFILDGQEITPIVQDHLLIFNHSGHNLQYAFQNFPHISIYNKKGTPLSPFILTL